ncbi:MAG TPA: GntR family transcriptional regulator [Marinobacter sp.]|nr:GntR family transcriptional regulator [Marinobacter sp.]
MSSSNFIFEEIKRKIITGEFSPGERLREATLAEEFNVSRTPVREALRQLSESGLVVFLKNQGARVRVWKKEEILDSYEIREAMEAIAAKRAATQISDSDLKTLKVLHQKMTALAEQDAPDIEIMARYNAEFHSKIITAANSPRLALVIKSVVEIPLVRRTFLRYSRDQLNRSLDHHRELLSAFEAHDGDWASSVMHRHIRAASHIVAED